MNYYFDCEAIVFDFDGVLCDSVNIKSNAFASLYAGYGDAVVSEVVAFHEYHGGLSRYEKIHYFESTILGKSYCQKEIDDLAQQFSQLVEMRVISSPWIPGAQGLLENLHQQIPMFVVSGTPHEELGRIIESRNMVRYFVATFGTPPEKEMLVENIVGQFRLTSNKTVMVGDSCVDMRAAQANQFQFIGINPSGREDPFPNEILTLPDLSELNRYLNIIAKTNQHLR